jgi:hypothetical protein
VAANLFTDLAEHAGALVALLGGIAVICMALVGAIYKLNNSLIDRVQGGLEKHLSESRECQKELPIRFAGKSETSEALSILFRRQNQLREEILPGTYMRKGDMDAWVVLNEKTFAMFTARLDMFTIRIDKLIEVVGIEKAKGGVI